jgi:hypothetical protein
MKIKIIITDKIGAKVIERLAEISQPADLAQEVSVAVEDARKRGLEHFGWSLHVDKV